MEFPGGKSWRAQWGSEHGVNLALYVRDALALSVTTDPELPPLQPPVPVYVPAGVDRDAVQRQWPGWWTEILAYCQAERPPDPHEWLMRWPGNEDSPSLRGRPELLAAVRVLRPVGRAHVAGHGIQPPSQQLDLLGIMRELETERGREARPFRLVITEISVAGAIWHRLTPEHVLISSRFRTDEAVCRAELRTLLAELF